MSNESLAKQNDAPISDAQERQNRSADDYINAANAVIDIAK